MEQHLLTYILLTPLAGLAELLFIPGTKKGFILFYIFWELVLVPMYFIIGVWGGPRKLYAAIKFFLYTLAGSVLMLLGILFLYFHHHQLTGQYTFSIPALYHTAPQ